MYKIHFIINFPEFQLTMSYFHIIYKLPESKYTHL